MFTIMIHVLILLVELMNALVPILDVHPSFAMSIDSIEIIIVVNQASTSACTNSDQGQLEPVYEYTV